MWLQKPAAVAQRKEPYNMWLWKPAPAAVGMGPYTTVYGFRNPAPAALENDRKHTYIIDPWYEGATMTG